MLQIVLIIFLSGIFQRNSPPPPLKVASFCYREVWYNSMNLNKNS